MVKLRLRRKGRIHHPVYDIIAVDGRTRRDGAYLERLGFYDPNNKSNQYKINVDRVLYWLGVGAQPTDTVNLLLSYEGILLRKHLALKGKTQAEIEEAVAKHKEVVKARYERRAKLRAERVIRRQKEKEEAEKAKQA